MLATRALGQSALSVASITAVGKSFDRRVGVAMGVYSVLLSLLFAAAFTAVGTAVRVSGWRTAWAQVAFGLVLFAAPVVLLLRERPARPSSDAAEADDDEGLSLAAALRTPAFWVFGGATSLFGLVSSGLGLFNQAVLAERGFDQQTYVRFLATTSIIALTGQLACGWLTLHWSMQRLLGLAMFIYAVALAALPLLATLSQLWIFAALIGLSGGMITVLFFAVWRHAFGPAHLGRIQGAAQMLTVLASAIGPLIFAQCAALTGPYTPALWMLAPCVLLLSVAAFRVPMPARRLSREVTPMAGAIDDTLRKFHASLNVSDLDRSIAFYRVLLGAEPAKVRSDYAKFDLAEPPLVLSLIPGRPGAGGNLNHVGLRVRNAEELVEIQRRLEAAGLHTEREEGVECCYALQTKFWITDPDRALWEIYVFHDDIDEHGSGAPPRVEQLRMDTAQSQAPLAWEHQLRDPIPSRIPHDDNTLHEVRLEGSINVAPDAGNRSGLLAESLRALRPGGRFTSTAWPGIARSFRAPLCLAPRRRSSIYRQPVMSSTNSFESDSSRFGSRSSLKRRTSSSRAFRCVSCRSWHASRVTGRERRRTRQCIWDRWGRSPTTSATCSVEACPHCSTSTIGRCCRKVPRAARSCS